MFNWTVTTRAFVDDLAIFTDSDTDILRGVQALQDFCSWTNARLNKVKSKALGLGSWTQRKIWPVPWLAADSTLTLFGIPFSSSFKETTARVWDATFGHLQGLVRTNIGRCFSLHQKGYFLKSEADSRIFYIGQILPCPPPPAIGVKIQSGAIKFLWAGRQERPPPGAIYRPTNDGGLAMFHTDLFLKALFLRPIAMALLGQDSSACFLLRNWLVFPTRPFLHLYKVTPVPAALFQRLAHTETALQHLRMILANGSPLPPPLTHRRIYTRHLVPKFTSGHVELAQPQLDWEAIWRSAKFLPPATRESQFLFNHRLLFTRDRCNEIDPRVDPVSDRCHIEIEMAVHLMTGCPA